MGGGVLIHISGDQREEHIYHNGEDIVRKHGTAEDKTDYNRKMKAENGGDQIHQEDGEAIAGKAGGSDGL